MDQTVVLVGMPLLVQRVLALVVLSLTRVPLSQTPEPLVSTCYLFDWLIDR